MRTIAALIAGLLLSLTTFVAGLAVALTLLNAGEPEHRLDSQNTAALWPTEPVAVDKASQPFERLPARPAPKEKKPTVMSKAGAGARATLSSTRTALSTPETEELDTITTGAIEAEPTEMDAPRRTWKTVAHVEWCSRRYRSYNAEDNSYRPYGGGRRACRSPYSTVAAGDISTAASESRERVTTASQERRVPEEEEVVADEEPVAVNEEPVAEDDPPVVDQASLESAPDIDSDSEEHIRSCFARYRSYRPEDNTYQPFDGGPRRQCR